MLARPPLAALLIACAIQSAAPQAVPSVAATFDADASAVATPVRRARAQAQPEVWPREADAGEGDARPKPPPRRWLGLVGEYGDERKTRYIVERAGRLWLIDGQGFDIPLREVSTDVFDSPIPGEDRYKLVKRVFFKRDARGRATEIMWRVDGTLRRRQVGPAEGSGQLRVEPVRPVEELLRESLTAEPPKESGEFRPAELVELVKLDPTIKLDIRYATTNNFLGSVFYAEPRAFLQRPAAEAAVRVHRKLRELGYGLLVHDGYRPWYVTKTFWDATPADKKWLVANPASGSKHNRGAAVDLTLYDLKTGRAVEMPSTYDESTHRAYAFYPGGTSLQRWHRALLRRAMEAEGFTVNSREWWHFDFRDWQKYRIGNIPFDQIK
jgi:D-alanyl-D-alanine dipeptidase